MDFSFLVKTLLLETPDKVAGKWEREDYNFELFIGDENGVFLTIHEPHMTSHADFLRALRDFEVIDPKTYKVLDTSAWIHDFGGEILGNPQKVNTFFSGIILPKQKDVDGTYVAIWSENVWKSSPIYRKLLIEYVLESYLGPYYWDVPIDMSDSDQSKIIPFKKV